MKEPFRKPVWTTIAPSKLYRIQKKEELTPEEEAYRKNLERNYSLAIKSINAYLNKEFYQPTLGTGGRTPEEVKSEVDEQEELLKANALENENVKEMREVRLRDFQAEKEARLLAELIAKEEENKQLGEQLDEIIKQEIERSKTYITKENLDEKIEQVLAHPVSYDFAIDRRGQVVFDGSLHPYAFEPKAVPETSDVTAEFKKVDTSKAIFLKASKLF